MICLGRKVSITFHFNERQIKVTLGCHNKILPPQQYIIYHIYITVHKQKEIKDQNEVVNGGYLVCFSQKYHMQSSIKL